jgi:hypothetical protein
VSVKFADKPCSERMAIVSSAGGGGGGGWYASAENFLVSLRTILLDSAQEK